MSTVLVFGAFDGLHPGHAHFLAEAKTHAERLVVCLATDAAIARLKGHMPRNTFEDRKAALFLLPQVDDVVAGDDEDGSYSSVVHLRPDVVAFGYDQQTLKEDFQTWNTHQSIGVRTVTISPFAPERYKSSLLNP